jgi:hypothetical protein
LQDNIIQIEDYTTKLQKIGRVNMQRKHMEIQGIQTNLGPSRENFKFAILHVNNNQGLFQKELDNFNSTYYKEETLNDKKIIIWQKQITGKDMLNNTVTGEPFHEHGPEYIIIRIGF